MKFIIQYKNQYIKVEANEKYFHIDKSYRFTSIKNMKNIINKIKGANSGKGRSGYAQLDSTMARIR